LKRRAEKAADGDSPVFASQDVEIQLALKDDSLMGMPQTVLIKKGEYFTNFDVTPLTAGETELSIFGEELPLKTYDLEVISLEPEISISAPEIIEKDDFFDAVVTVMFAEKPLADSNVSWNVNGAFVQLSDKKTNSEGTATISVIGTDEKAITIDASISGSWYTPTSISKTIKINSTSSEYMEFAEGGSSEQYTQIDIFGFDPVVILVPLAIGASAFFLRKNGMLKIKK